MPSTKIFQRKRKNTTANAMDWKNSNNDNYKRPNRAIYKCGMVVDACENNAINMCNGKTKYEQ